MKVCCYNVTKTVSKVGIRQHWAHNYILRYGCTKFDDSHHPNVSHVQVDMVEKQEFAVFSTSEFSTSIDEEGIKKLFLSILNSVDADIYKIVNGEGYKSVVVPIDYPTTIRSY